MLIKDFIQNFIDQRALGSAFSETAEHYYLPLLQNLKEGHSKETIMLGINGAQGSGKSTLADFLVEAASEFYGWKVTSLSLDDIYYSKADRLELARKVHPLLATRGVPGTHDLDLGVQTLRGLKRLGQGDSLPVPRFNKATDDQFSPELWHRVEGQQDLVIFEGWCVGCRAQPEQELLIPHNQLEAKEDSRGVWRRYVNRAIGEYESRLWSLLDSLVMLRVPSFEQVYEWRTEQECKLCQELGEKTELADPDKMRHFISHYERLTRYMLEEMPQRADLLMELNAEHRVYAMRPELTAFSLADGESL